MAELIIAERPDIVAIANAVRSKTGKTEELTLSGIISGINGIETGTDLPELINEGSASDLLFGKELIDDEGNVVTGTFTIDNELTTQDNLIAQIQTALQNKASASEPVLQSKTVTPTTSSQTIKPDSGYDGLSKVTVGAIPSTYVKPTSTKVATTYTPTTSNQTIAAGTYCSGVQTIVGDSNLVAENIAEGVSIFGVTGTHSGGSGGASVETCTVSISLPDEGVVDYLTYMQLQNGEVVPVCDATAYKWLDGVYNIAIENVVSNTLLTVTMENTTWGDTVGQVTGGTICGSTGWQSTWFIFITAGQGETARIYIYNDW